MHTGPRCQEDPQKITYTHSGQYYIYTMLHKLHTASGHTMCDVHRALVSVIASISLF